MPGWRISKYDPALRDEAGRFLGDEWTAFSDVGRVFDGEVLTLVAYRRTEDAYLEVAAAFHRASGSPPFHARGVECRRHIAPAAMEGELIDERRLREVVRACLREAMWCRLEADSGCSIHFGYDYYMYFTCDRPIEPVLEVARREGLFVERFASPYGPRDEGVPGSRSSRGEP